MLKQAQEECLPLFQTGEIIFLSVSHHGQMNLQVGVHSCGEGLFVTNNYIYLLRD